MSSEWAGKIPSSRIWLISCLILLLVAAVGGWFVTGYLGDKAKHEIFEYNEAAISLHSSHLTAVFEKNERAVKAMSGSPWIAPAFISRKEQDIANANKVLDRYNTSMDSSVSYLLDVNGMTIASSNRNDSDSFVGKSYQFRPYFTQAINGTPGRYFALGATSLKRGFYASYPVRDGKGVIIGVAVIKQDVDGAEIHLANYPNYFVVDPNGVIFLSGRKEINLKSLWPVSRETRLALLESKQFGKRDFDPVLPREVRDGTEITFEGEKRLASRKVINPEGWSAVLMTTMERVLIYQLAGIILTVFLCILIVAPLVIHHRTLKSAEVVRESEQKYSLTFKTSLDAVNINRLEDGLYVDINEGFTRITGFTREEVIGRTSMDISIWNEASDRQKLVRNLLEKGFCENLESVFRKKDGSLINGLVSARVLPLKGIPHIISISRDITGLKKLEARKAELEIQAQRLQKAESLGRMAGAIAHNFNNQLGVVIGNLDIAMHYLSGTEEPSKLIREAMKAARKASDTSGLMLTYLGHAEGKHEPLDLSLTCSQRLNMIRALMPKELELKTNLPFRGPVIRADERQIAQALTNLITNAWEAMVDRQGGINLTVKTVSPSGIHASYRFPVDWQAQETDYACIEVADKGCGIDSNEIEKLFDPFYSTKFTGRGLGLSVVLGIVRSHSGVITVESNPGEGSIFRLFFPVSPEQVRKQADMPVSAVMAKTAKTPELSNAKDSGTVLVVEDEAAMRKMAGIMLTHMGYTVLAAKDGVNAVDVLRKHKGEIRCVLCDLTMPGMDGWKTMAALRKISPSLPVVLTSGYDIDEVMKSNRTDSPNTFLSKPFHLKELGDAICRAVDHGAVTGDRLTKPDIRFPATGY